MSNCVYGYGDGLLTKDGRRIFPIGFYELPEGDDELGAMAEAGERFRGVTSKEILWRLAV